MNFGEIKSFLKGAPLFDAERAKGPQNTAAQLKPKFHGFAGASAVVERSQSAMLGFNVLNKVVTDKLQTLDPSGGSQAKKNEDLFDFKEVAKNVMTFVEKMVMKAKGEGADNDKLSEMLNKARQGIDDGFAQARSELGEMGEMNEEVTAGIDNSYDLIQQGLNRFEDRLFKPQDMEQVSVSSAQLNYSLSKSSSITIQTNDGDEVTIDFAEALSYQNSQQSASYRGTDADGNSTQVQAEQRSESLYQAMGFSFSVKGDLDDGEKEAIASLVQDVSQLADEFFNGDLDKAFNQATQLGFDESELSGFAVQLSRVETISVSQSYQQAARYDDVGRRGQSGQSGEAPGKQMTQLVKPVASYLNDLMAFFEKAREQLNDGNDLQSLVSQSVNKYLEFTGETDLLASFERFASFNQRLLSVFEQMPNAANEGSAGSGATSEPLPEPGVAIGEPNGRVRGNGGGEHGQGIAVGEPGQGPQRAKSKA